MIQVRTVSDSDMPLTEQEAAAAPGARRRGQQRAGTWQCTSSMSVRLRVRDQQLARSVTASPTAPNKSGIVSNMISL
jgi:hypothetical protein